MRVYAEKPLRAVVQVVIDVAVVVWMVVAVRLATGTHAAILRWKEPGRNMIDAGGRLEGTFVDAAGTADALPFVGGDLSRILRRGTVAGDVLSEVGRRELEAVGYLATGVAVIIVLLALIPVLAVWLPRRLRYARAAGVAVRLRAHAGDLLALRALNDVPYRRLRRIAVDPAAAWRRGDPEVIDALAHTQLAKLGLRPPRRAHAASHESASIGELEQRSPLRSD